MYAFTSIACSPFIAAILSSHASILLATTECTNAGNGCLQFEDTPLMRDVAASDSSDSEVHLVQIGSKIHIKHDKLQAPNGTKKETNVTKDREAVDKAIDKALEDVLKTPESGAAASGLTMNAEGDLAAFIAALVSNLAMIAVCVAIFMSGRNSYPTMFYNNVLCGIQNYQVPDKWFGWAYAALGISVDEIAETVGLDQGMLIEFAQMNMKILATFGLPMLLVTGPMNCFLGGYAAGKDYLSYLSFGNVEQGSWLHWVHCFVVWGVVFTVQVHIYSYMEKFIQRRIDWLERLPRARATTIFVEGIPTEYQTDERLKEFFCKLFGEKRIKSASMVKRAKALQKQYHRKLTSAEQLESLKFKWEEHGSDPEKRPKSWRGVDLIEYYEQEIVEAEQGIKDERAEARKSAEAPGGVNGYNGFVFFYEPADAEIALSMMYSNDSYQWAVSTPPPPESIRWGDLEQSPHGQAVWTILGYLLTAGLYMLYLPIVIWMTTIAIKITLPGALQSFWEALAPTVGLQFMVCFLPTFLNLIFSSCFTLNDDAYSQKILQNWYFLFQFVFVIMVTAIGDSLFLFMKTLVVSPLEIMPMLAATMPHATHFYMNFLVLAWASHGMNFTRYIPVMKFLTFRKLFDAEKARQMAEPEDQDYYGLGSRHARFAIMMSIGIIFGTLSPPIPLLAFINFFFCRLFYGYLIPFAETKKPDLGGLFFVSACQHLFVANIVYVLLMTGVLFARASSGVPATIAGVSLFYVVWSMHRFGTEFRYEKLPFQEHVKDLSTKIPRKSEGVYIQPEWVE